MTDNISDSSNVSQHGDEDDRNDRRVIYAVLVFGLMLFVSILAFIAFVVWAVLHSL